MSRSRCPRSWTWSSPPARSSSWGLGRRRRRNRGRSSAGLAAIVERRRRGLARTADRGGQRGRPRRRPARRPSTRRPRLDGDRTSTHLASSSRPVTATRWAPAEGGHDLAAGTVEGERSPSHAPSPDPARPRGRTAPLLGATPIPKPPGRGDDASATTAAIRPRTSGRRAQADRERRAGLRSRRRSRRERPAASSWTARHPPDGDPGMGNVGAGREPAPRLPPLARAPVDRVHLDDVEDPSFGVRREARHPTARGTPRSSPR